MKNKLLLVAVFLISSITYGHAQTDYNIEAITVINLGDGRLLFRTLEDELPVQGSLRLIDGRKSEYILAEFENGLYNGNYQHFKHNALREEGSYKEGRKNGTFKEYNSDGTTVKTEKKYINGKANGMWVYYYTNGSPEREKEYKNGLEHGVERKYDHESGELITEMNFSEGKKHGKQLQSISSNRIDYTIRSNYNNGLLEGAYSEIYSNDVVKKAGKYKNGKEDGVWKFNKYDGKPESEITYKNGKKDGEEKKFFTDGTVSTINTYKDGKLNGPKKEFYYQSNGKLKSVYNYKDGRREGPYTLYNEDGTKKQEGSN